MDKRMEINKVVKESLCEALIYFMERKPFQNITITELITKAGVARATYYRNFDSKEDLARAYIMNIVDEFSRENCNDERIDSYERILICWKYIEKYKNILILYNKAGLSNLLLDSLSNITFYKFERNRYKNIDDTYFAAFVGALFSVVRKWLLEGAKVPAEEMARQFSDVWNGKYVR